MNAMVMRLGPWRIERTLGRDLSGTYYTGRSDHGERATLYLLSGELEMPRREPLTQLLLLHRELRHPGLVRFHDLDHDGSDLYLIAEPVDDALASLRSGNRPEPGQTVALGAALGAALSAAHDLGLVHGGLELDNVVWAPGRAPQILGTGVAALGIADREALAHGDVAALGRLLCALVAGRRPADATGSTAEGRTFELVRLLADPVAVMSMREALALLSDGAPTFAGLGGGGTTAEHRAARGTQPHGEPALTGAVHATAQTVVLGAEPVGEAAARSAARPGRDAIGGFLGRYRILTRLGRGGMGEVFLAEDPVLRRGVAIKRIRPGLERDRTFRARLRREAQLAARLSHRAIVQVFDLVTDEAADHVIMEYVSGPSLHTLAGGKAMPVPEAVRIAIEVIEGLAYAHQQGIIHRDLKVENILIGTDGQPKIADFGIARRAASGGGGGSLGGEPEALTRDGVAIGTSRAMSPEQVQGQALDPRSDLFSFGVLLYELVTGASPFAANNDAVTIMRVLSDRQRSARELAPAVPAALSDLIDQLLEKAPERRPDSARVVRDRLRALDTAPAPGPEPPARPAPGEPRPRARTGPVTVPAGGERRQVTLVCVELVAASGGSDEHADPELLAELLSAFRARVDDVLARFDGLLISALGRRFVACFGHPRPVEDAARRAVLAGGALLSAAGELRCTEPAHRLVRFTAVGAIHTGLAVARGVATAGGTGEELVLGATLDGALELVQLGRPGDLWLSGAAARLVDGEFQLEPAVTLGGGATVARRFGGARGFTASGSGAHDRPMVARDHEMQLLLGCWRRVRQGTGQVALLIGEPGIGKSRLTRELAAALGGEPPRQVVLRGGAYRQRSALEPVADAVAGLLGVGATAVGTAERGGGSGLADQVRDLAGGDAADHVLHLLGRGAPPAGPPERARHLLLGGLRDILIGAGDAAPTLIIAEDLHWLDASTLEVIALVIAELALAPVFLVMTTRPGFAPPWPASAPVTQLHLGRLDAAAIDAMIAQAVGDRALPAAERAAIAARCEGVPLYAQELVRAALELGRAGEVPSTLRDALTARLHQLGPEATRVAHVAAVAGREFTAELVATAGGIDRASVDRELERLVAGEILIRRRGRGREVQHQFGHVLLQQAAYDELLAGDRRHLHGQIADALLADERAGRDPGPELIAHHLAGARRFDQAIAQTQRAALRDLARHARVEARELLRQALAWLDQLPGSDARDRSEIGLRMQLGAVLISTEGYTSPELERSTRRTEALCKRHHDMPFPVKYGLWAVRLMRGSSEEVAPFLHWFEQEIDRNGPPVERMMAHASIGTYAYSRAEYARAAEHLDRSMALFVPGEHAGVVQVYGGCGGFYGHVITTKLLWTLGRIADAWQHSRTIIAQAQALDPYALVSALGFEMGLHIASNDVAGAEATAERMLELCARYEFVFLACSALCGRGWALSRRGQGERAIGELVRGTEGTRQIGVKVYFPYYLGLLADGATVLGDFDRAERALDEALEISRTSVDCGNEPELLRLRGQLILARDASARGPARAVLGDAVALARRRGALGLALRAAIDLARLLRDDGALDEAAAVLAPVCAGYAPGLDDPHLAAARQLLAELPGQA